METTALEQKKVVAFLETVSKEVAAAFVTFPEHKKQVIWQMTLQPQTAWCKLHHEILILKRRKADLEYALLNDNLKGETLVTANATLESINKSLNTLYAEEENMLYPQSTGVEQPNLYYDRNARPGVVSIRPTYKGTPSLPTVRK